MKTRMVSLVIVLALILGVASVANAQGGDECFNLPEEDCAVLLAAQANTNDNLHSFYNTFVVDVNVGGLATLSMMTNPSAAAGAAGANAAVEDFNFHVEGEGPFTSDAEIDMTNFVNAFAMAMDMTASVSTEEESQPVSFVIVDGIYYQIAPPAEIEDLGIDGAFGFPLEAAMNIAMQQGATSGLPGMPSGAMTPEDLAGTDPSAMLEQFGLSAEMLQAFEGLNEVPGFVNFERLADEDMMGQTMYPFSQTWDFTTLFASEEFQTALQGLMSGAAQADPSAAQMGMMVPMFLSGATLNLNVTQWVGADDQFIHKLSVDVTGSLDLSVLMSSGGNQANMPQLDPITLDVHFEVSLDQANETFEITAPEGAPILTEEQLQQLMGAATEAAQ